MRSRLVLPAVLVVGLVAGFVLSASARPRTLAGFLSDQSCSQTYGLINPWLRCEPDQNIQKKKEFTDFKKTLEEYVRFAETSAKTTHASVYIRDLQFGPWTGINEQESFSAASLLKIPVMMAVLKYAEQHPEILEQQVTIGEEFKNYFQAFSPENPVVAGGTYTIDELLTHMIIQSDNNAKDTLNVYLNYLSPMEDLMAHTFEELGLATVYLHEDDELTVKQVGSLFRILYNGSYLNKDMSQKALGLLADAHFDFGIMAGVPSGVVVAHKFGEREYENGEHQLHDCGVIYYPDNHYLLCVMTRGDDTMEQASVIADISRMVYQEMKARNAGE